MTSPVTRRRFLSLAAASAACAALPSFAIPNPHHPAAQDFSFLFLTDCHLQPELDAVHGTDLAMLEARKLKLDFAIQGGDHVFDALGISHGRATQLFDQYGKTEQDLGLKVHHVLGNHDIFGVYPASGAAPADPGYGKKMFAERFGPTWYSFDHKGVHFIVLDSVGYALGHYYAVIEQEQIDWLAKDLAAQPAGAPIVVTSHIPLVSAWQDYAPHDSRSALYPGFINGPKVIAMFEGHNVLAVLQGHTHINETVLWKGIPYITSGAVCGNWWKGVRWGVPEGFTVVSIASGKLTTRYQPTGFKSVAPEPS